jgi:hypothetical protein
MPYAILLLDVPAIDVAGTGFQKHKKLNQKRKKKSQKLFKNEQMLANNNYWLFFVKSLPMFPKEKHELKN